MLVVVLGVVDLEQIRLHSYLIELYSFLDHVIDDCCCSISLASFVFFLLF